MLFSVIIRWHNATANLISVNSCISYILQNAEYFCYVFVIKLYSRVVITTNL